MLCENLIETQNEELDLSVTVRVTNLDLPRSEEQLKDELLAHALECHECLTVVLFQEDSLADCGCPVYRQMFCEATEELLRHAPVDASAHFTDELLENFFLDRLTEEQMNAMSDHIGTCPECHGLLEQREAFYLSIKAAVQNQKTGSANSAGLNGVLGVNIPDEGLYYCSRINE